VDTGYANAESVDTLVPIHRLIRPCPQCGKKFNTRAQVILHLKRVHLQHREFPCEFCEKSYSSQNYLASHVKAEHKKQASSIIRARDFVCKFCGTAFVQKCKSFRVHLQSYLLGSTNNDNQPFVSLSHLRSKPCTPWTAAF